MSPTEAIERYATAFAARDAKAILALFAQVALYEMPLLRSRMVGLAEIAAGLERAFAVASEITIVLERMRAQGPVAMAEGVMTARIEGEGAGMRVPFAIVASLAGDRLDRLSVYLDARPHRLWSDGPVLALGA
jgi:ketosteroid isomerase-like protein